jgi:transposase-like protein
MYSREFKEAAIGRMLAGEKIATIAADLRLRPQLLYSWRDLYEHGGADALVPRGRPRRAVGWARRRALLQPPSQQARVYGHAGEEGARDPRVVELERKVGQQALELDFFKAALRHVEAPPRRSAGRGSTASSRSSAR